MKKTVFFTIIILLSFGLAAQTTKKKKKKPAPKPTAPIEIALPERCFDCFFAVKLQADIPFGPTEPLQGPGYVNEIHRDAQTQNVFEQEHNSIWYSLEIPYDGKLLIDIKPKGASDDYDFLVYKYTDKYFCNRIEKNRVKPIRSVQSISSSDVQGRTGLSLKGSMAHIKKSSDEAFGKYIDVKAGESYIIVLDNLTDGGLGHTITCEVWTDFAPLYIQPMDSLKAQRTTADIYVKELETGRVVVDKKDAGSMKIKLLPGKTYNVSLSKEGYFRMNKTITHEQAAAKDSIFSAKLIEIKPGSNIPLEGELYFDENEQNEIVVMKECYHAFDGVIKTLNEYPQINIDIIGRIATEGLNVKKDNEISRKRAEAIKNYLVSQGINENRIRTRGSSIKELEKQLKDQQKLKNKIITPQCEIKIAAKR
ncbi:MAG: OmpA family protein [Bacteroidales bacterium]|nr:OmpA family protein [Bacteroidales bacterium]